MAEPKTTEAPPGTAASAAAAAPKNEGNPAFRAMGLPRWRKRLPSRNWMIFFGIVGSFSAAVIYDKRETRRIQQKYCNAVAHLPDEQLRPNALPRKIRIFLGAPPGDYLSPAREYFKQYIKPILVASAVDWEVFEGRKEGDIRYKLAETIREQRRKAGEGSKDGMQEPDVDDMVNDIRERAGVSISTERSGDLVIGRHTWKEYVRGLHEGWLGPVDIPESIKNPDGSSGVAESEAAATETSAGRPGNLSDLPVTVVKDMMPTQSPPEDAETSMQTTADDASPQSDNETAASESASNKVEKEVDKKPEPDLTLPYIRPNAYQPSTLSPITPDTFAPTVAVPFPHLLGFLRTPIRVWRFLNRRHLAESTGAAVTAFILAPDEYIRSFDESSTSDGTSPDTFADADGHSGSELQRKLQGEEADWHKSARKPNEPGKEDKERPWQEDMSTVSDLTSKLRTIDVEAFLRDTGLASEGLPGASDVAGSALAKAAGNVLAGSSGGEDSTADASIHFGPRPIGWKSGADRMDPLSWGDWLKQLVGIELDTRPKPWNQGFVGSEEQ